MKLLTNQNEIHLIAETPHGKVPYWGKICTVLAKDIVVYDNKKYFDKLCRNGCPNYAKKWSCPPYAPSYAEFFDKYQKLSVVVLGLNMNELAYIKQDYLKIRAANSMLKSRIDKTLRICKKDSEKYVSTGSCRLCKPCHKKIDKPCVHQDIRTYSFEALGINVSAMVQDIFGVSLLWYKKGSLPVYTCVVAGLLSNEKLVDERITSKLKELR